MRTFGGDSGGDHKPSSALASGHAHPIKYSVISNHGTASASLNPQENRYHGIYVAFQPRSTADQYHTSVLAQARIRIFPLFPNVFIASELHSVAAQRLRQ
jgi:hypothetical protein